MSTNTWTSKTMSFFSNLSLRHQLIDLLVDQGALIIGTGKIFTAL